MFVSYIFQSEKLVGPLAKCVSTDGQHRPIPVQMLQGNHFMELAFYFSLHIPLKNG